MDDIRCAGVTIPSGLPTVIGHRGAAAEAPENTLAGLRRARHSGARWVEVDAKLSGDGVPILFHDETLERTTDGSGPVHGRSFGELRRLDAGAWFADGHAGERIPSLDEALDLCLALGLGLNLEIKPCAGRERETAAAVVAALRARAAEDLPPLLLSSFRRVCLEAAAELAPDLPRGFLKGHLPADWLERAQDLGCATVHLGWQRLTRESVERVRDAGYPVVVYTVNDLDRARRLIAWGVSSVITDTVRSFADAGLDAGPG